MQTSNFRVLVTGANGFIGKNLIVRLNELTRTTITTFVRSDDVAILPQLVAQVDAVIHLAGENRPTDEAAFKTVNAELTAALCDAIRQECIATGRQVTLVLASSAQAEHNNPYGRSKLEAEQAVLALSQATNNPCIVFRLPGVFGKWCRPNYNSVVATFCNNLSRNLPIKVHDPNATIELVYIDDVINSLLNALEASRPGYSLEVVQPMYTTTLGELASQIRSFADCRSKLMTERVGTGFVRALYATYMSYLPNENFSYEIQQHVDPRGVFVEILKTPDSGQFSYFTAHPGVTRGGHYHHTKTEKFLVIKGEALFRFRHLLSGELVELRTGSYTPEIVDTIPGWAHDITNVGDDELVVMVWANENFNQQQPDTVARKI